MSKRVYISGQMTRLPREEYLARFAKAEKLLKEQGYTVVNPTKFFICRHLWTYRIVGYVGALLYDLWRLNQCDLIYKMPGWKQSRGANIESCWAFHMGAYLLPPKTRSAIDLKLAKFAEKRTPSSGAPAIVLSSKRTADSNAARVPADFVGGSTPTKTPKKP